MKKLLTTVISLTAALAVTACGSSGGTAERTETAAPAETTAAPAESSETAADAHEAQADSGEFTVLGDFTKGSSEKFYASDGWSNGNMFDCTWKKENVKFGDGVMKLTIDATPSGEHTAAEYRTHEFCGYGLYEVCMKPIRNNGVVSSFFTYTGPSDENPWDEIDIEFLGKDTTKVQFNYFTDGKGDHELLYDLGFDASEDFHTYGFEWLEGSIKWYVDGKEVHSVTENIPKTPGRLMMNVWNGKGVDAWLAPYDGTAPLTAEYKWARFTAR
ncbi:MAG: glycoside hydrolase family 16 protein [Ruminococcus sp.]|nr:glycoside hydrolase family 16 protein [Ruminococcus sp.]